MFFFFFEFDKPASKPLKGNKGEWAEIYIFLKLLADGKVYAADKNMEKILEKYLKILRIFREEMKNYKLEYFPGKTIHVKCGDEMACPDLELNELVQAKDRLWKLISSTSHGNITDQATQDFLRKLCIAKLKSPADGEGFFGGTKDIVMEVEDYKTGIASVVGFSCKSDFGGQATLFNASKDNTNFLFRIVGEIDDALAAKFNGMFDVRGGKQVVATARRMKFLKEKNCTLVFEKAVAPSARRNLMMVGGRELACMLAEMIRHYYYDGEGASAYCAVADLVHWVSKQNVCGVEDFGCTEDFYWYQVSRLLYAMFTGMRLGSAWNGRSSVTGGYIVARDDGEVLAYHTCIADEFMDFLVQRLAIEQPSHKRHLSMRIEKASDGNFYIKLPLQFRFRGMKKDVEPDN